MCYRVFCWVIGALVYFYWFVKWDIIIGFYCYMELYIIDSFQLFNGVYCKFAFCWVVDKKGLVGGEKMISEIIWLLYGDCAM